ncbi:hypothetical protein [Vibrio sp. E150_018]
MLRASNSIGVVTLIGVYIYCADMAYTGGYLNTLGLDSDVLGREFYPTLYSGFKENFIHLFMLLAACIIWFFLIDIRNAFRESKEGKEFLAFLETKMTYIFKGENKSSTSKEKEINFCFSILFAFALFILMMAMNEGLGKQKAIKVMNGIENLEYTKVYTHNMVDDLAFLYCGAVNCAVFNIQKQRTEYISNNNFMVDNHRIKRFLGLKEASDKANQK